MSAEIYIGVISGTSVDALDCVACSFDAGQCEILAQTEYAIPPALKSQLKQLSQPGMHDIDVLGQVDVALGQAIATAINSLISEYQLPKSDIKAIGSHGQTIRHRPDECFTLQIGNANIIAYETGIKTVADFRSMDVAAGGQGAPLVPLFHQAFFGDEASEKVILNIGGISNISVLKRDKVLGFDCGPGNTLLDAWCQLKQNQSYDENGDWGRTGEINKELLAMLLDEPYFKKLAPKSTGTEYFNLAWLNEKSALNDYAPEDIQSTLVELSAFTIAADIQSTIEPCNVFVCGGGAHNIFLLERLQENLKTYKVGTTDELGIPVDYVEACTFAWLAYRHIKRIPSDLRLITGSTRPIILGVSFHP